MTLVNRLLSGRTRRSYSIRTLQFDGLDCVLFSALVEGIHAELYDTRTDRGRLVLFGPSHLRSR